MTRVEFDHLVEHLEQRFRNRGLALTRAAVFWAMMGYTVLVLGLLISWGLVLFFGMAIYLSPSALTFKLGVVAGLSGGVVGWSILRGIWVRMEPPEGEELTCANEPRLFEVTEAISAQAGSIRFHRVLLSEDLNACVIQVPRLGIFGMHRNYLCLGLQLMEALPPEEFQAVLAHEFAHLSRSHGRTGNWLYRMRRSWEIVACSLSSQGGISARPLGLFFEWFWPRFNARAFVLSRHNEFEADAFSAVVTSPTVAASALLRIAITSQRMDRDFWERLDERSAREPEPPAAIFEELAEFLKTSADTADLDRWTKHALARHTDTSDTHPALKDRLAALGVDIALAGVHPVRESAADVLLGKTRAASARADFSQTWLTERDTAWRQNHKRHCELLEELNALDTHDSSVEKKWERLSIECNLRGVPAMAEKIASFVESHPEHHGARFTLGGHLLFIDDPTGVSMLEAVAEALPLTTLECFNHLAAYYDRQGNAQAIRELKRRADEHEALMVEALGERSRVSSGDHFDPHGLSEMMVSDIRVAADGIPQLQEAWLARKHVRKMPQWSSYVMIVRLKFPFLRLVTEKAKQQVLQKIADVMDVNGHLLVLAQSSDTRPVAAMIKRLNDAKIYSRVP